jgi:hypothetical protein
MSSKGRSDVNARCSDVRDALAVSPHKSSWTDDLHHDEGTFARGEELVHSHGVLDGTQD